MLKISPSSLKFVFSSSLYGGKFIFWFICMRSKVLILNNLCFSCLQKSLPCPKSIEILFCIFLLKVLKFCLSHYTCNWFFFLWCEVGVCFHFFLWILTTCVLTCWETVSCWRNLARAGWDTGLQQWAMGGEVYVIQSGPDVMVVEASSHHTQKQEVWPSQRWSLG